MIEIEPIVPYQETVCFPSIDASGNICMSGKPADREFVYTAGPVLDDEILDQPVPFKGFAQSYPPGERSVGFTVTRVGETYLIPEVVQGYELLVAQLLGALSFAKDPVSKFTHYYNFGITEMQLATCGGGVHPDGQGVDEFESAAITSNCFPTLYVLGQHDRPDKSAWHTEVDPRKVDPSRLWCPDPKSITVHSGEMLHSPAIVPPGTTGTRRLAELRHSGTSAHPIDVTRIMIDDQYLTISDAEDLLLR